MQDKSITSIVETLRNIAYEKGSHAAFKLFQNLDTVIDLEFQQLVFKALVDGSYEIKVRLENVGDQKIGIIKEVRGATGLSLRSAKDFVESVQQNGPQKLAIDNMEAAQLFVDHVRNKGGFACII